jgi:hypothetical protein
VGGAWRKLRHEEVGAECHGAHEGKEPSVRTRNRGEIILKFILEDAIRGLVMGYVQVACDFVTNQRTQTVIMSGKSVADRLYSAAAISCLKEV